MTHRKTAAVTKAVLCKILARKDVIFQALIVDKSLVFYHQSQTGVLKNVSKMWFKVTNRNSKLIDFP